MLSVKVQRANISGFVTINVSITTTQLCHWGKKTAIDDKWMGLATSQYSFVYKSSWEARFVFWDDACQPMSQRTSQWEVSLATLDGKHGALGALTGDAQWSEDVSGSLPFSCIHVNLTIFTGKTGRRGKGWASGVMNANNECKGFPKTSL